MPPKPTGASSKGKRKRVDDGLSEEARTMAKHDLSIHFSSEISKQRYETFFRDREIHPGKFVDFDELWVHNVKIESYFEKMNWLPMVEKEDLYYPSLVKVFYSNLQRSSKNNYNFSTWVQGIEIKITPSILSRILNIPIEGSGWVRSADWPNYLDPIEAMREFTNDPNFSIDAGFKHTSVGKLTVEMRVIHAIVCHCLVPRSGSYATISHLDAVLMWHIVHGTPYNLPYLICCRMVKATINEKGKLPYGMAITRILEHYKIKLDDYVGVKLDDTYKINKTSLKRMGWIYFLNGDVWVRKEDCDKVHGKWVRPQVGGTAGPSQDAQESHDEEEEPLSPQADPEVSNADILAAIHGLQNNMADLRREIQGLRNEVRDMRREFGLFCLQSATSDSSSLCSSSTL